MARPKIPMHKRDCCVNMSSFAYVWQVSRAYAQRFSMCQFPRDTQFSFSAVPRITLILSVAFVLAVPFARTTCM